MSVYRISNKNQFIRSVWLDMVDGIVRIQKPKTKKKKIKIVKAHEHLRGICLMCQPEE